MQNKKLHINLQVFKCFEQPKFLFPLSPFCIMSHNAHFLLKSINLKFMKKWCASVYTVYTFWPMVSLIIRLFFSIIQSNLCSIRFGYKYPDERLTLNRTSVFQNHSFQCSFWFLPHSRLSGRNSNSSILFYFDVSLCLLFLISDFRLFGGKLKNPPFFRLRKKISIVAKFGRPCKW